MKRKAKNFNKIKRKRKKVIVPTIEFTKEELKEHNLKRIINRVTKKLLKKSIERCNGSVPQVALLIGMERTYTYRLIRKFKLKEMANDEKKQW